MGCTLFATVGAAQATKLGGLERVGVGWTSRRGYWVDFCYFQAKMIIIIIIFFPLCSVPRFPVLPTTML